MKKISLVIQRIGIWTFAFILLCIVGNVLSQKEIINLPAEDFWQLIALGLGIILLCLASICICAALANFKMPNMTVPKGMPLFIIGCGIFIAGILIAVVMTGISYGMDFDYNPYLSQEELQRRFHVWIDQKNQTAHYIIIAVAITTIGLRAILAQRKKLIVWDV